MKIGYYLMRLLFCLSIVFATTSYESDLKTIQFSFGFSPGNNCKDELPKILLRLNERKDIEISSALCSFNGDEETELTLKFRWLEGGKKIVATALGLYAGGSDGQDPILSDVFNVYYGAYDSMAICQFNRDSFAKTYEAITGGFVLTTFCRKAFIGKYSLHVISIGAQKSSLRHLEFHLSGPVTNATINDLNKTVQLLGGKVVLTAVMTSWLSVNYFSEKELRVGQLDERPQLKFYTREECQVELDHFSQAFVQSFNFSFNVIQCIENRDDKMFSINAFYTKKLPDFALEEVKDFESWAECNNSRAALLDQWRSRGHERTTAIVCTKSFDSFATTFIAEALVVADQQ